MSFTCVLPVVQSQSVSHPHLCTPPNPSFLYQEGTNQIRESPLSSKGKIHLSDIETTNSFVRLLTQMESIIMYCVRCNSDFKYSGIEQSLHFTQNNNFREIKRLLRYSSSIDKPCHYTLFATSTPSTSTSTSTYSKMVSSLLRLIQAYKLFTIYTNYSQYKKRIHERLNVIKSEKMKMNIPELLKDNENKECILYLCLSFCRKYLDE